MYHKPMCIYSLIIQSHLGFNLPPAWSKKGSGNGAHIPNVKLLCASRGTNGQQEKKERLKQEEVIHNMTQHVAGLGLQGKGPVSAWVA